MKQATAPATQPSQHSGELAAVTSFALAVVCKLQDWVSETAPATQPSQHSGEHSCDYIAFGCVQAAGLGV
jgi:hypothetical protein